MNQNFVADALAFSLDVTRKNLATLTSFPEIAKNGQWLCSDDGFWTGGHRTGLLWGIRAYER